MAREIIFEDLEIDYSGYLSRPHEFVANVREAGERLRDLLRANDSIGTYLSALPKIDYDLREFKRRLDDLYTWVDENVPTQALPAVANELRNLAGSIEYIGRDRAITALAEANQGIDKAVIHQQYILLREKFAEWIKAATSLSVIEKGSVEPLPPMSGNYGSNINLVHVVYTFEDDLPAETPHDDITSIWEHNKTYRNHRAVAKRLGFENWREVTVQDVVEYIEANKECKVIISKVKS